MATPYAATTWLDTRDPTESEDGVQLGDTWLNSDAWNTFICTDGTVDALQWLAT
jgi:hypothetical protein